MAWTSSFKKGPVRSTQHKHTGLIHLHRFTVQIMEMDHKQSTLTGFRPILPGSSPRLLETPTN